MTAVVETLPRFLQLLTWTSYGKSVDTNGKSALKLVRTTKFDSDLFKTNEDIAPQRRKILQTFVCWGGQPVILNGCDLTEKNSQCDFLTLVYSLFPLLAQATEHTVKFRQ